jgi:predicted Zn-dependent peptidase
VERRRKPFTQAEVGRAQNLLQSAWLQGFETYHQRASTIGLYALDHQMERLEGYMPRLMALTPADVNDVAARYLDKLPLSSAHVGIG